MGEATKIQWAHHTWSPLFSQGRGKWMLPSPAFVPWYRLQVQALMAVSAKRKAIAHAETKFGVGSEGLDVVGLEVPAPGITALLAGKSIAGEYLVSPLAILDRSTIALVTLVLTVSVGVVVWAAGCSLASDARDFLPNIRRQRLTLPRPRPSLATCAHQCSRLESMRPAFERGRSTLGAFADGNPSAPRALRRPAIVPRCITRELAHRAPILALRAPLEPGRDARPVLVGGNSGALSRDLDCPF
jgi:hypothetical protein